jgi:hypothetical protein
VPATVQRQVQIYRLFSVSFFGHSRQFCPFSLMRNRMRQRLGVQAQPNGHGSVRGKMTTDKRSIMLTRIGSTISAGEGTLAGDILWLATIAFLFSVVIGIVG